jgi:hypothetical protein
MLYFSNNSGSKNFSSLDLKAILELSWYKKKFDSESDKNISIVHSIFNWLNIIIILKFSISVNCCIFFLIWLLVGREDLEGGEIEDDENNIGIADCEKFFFNYINCCAILLHSANLIIDRAASETASTY